MFDLHSKTSFVDANNCTCSTLDVVEYQYGARRGILLEALQDGDAFVIFKDNLQVEQVKWIRLCKVPLTDEQ